MARGLRNGDRHLLRDFDLGGVDARSWQCGESDWLKRLSSGGVFGEEEESGWRSGVLPLVLEIFVASVLW